MPRPPEISSTDPYSPMARANASAAPDAIAGRSRGSTTRRNVVHGPAPRQLAASSASTSRASRTGCTERTTNGNVTNSSASTIAFCVPSRLIPTGLSAPYTPSSTRPATIVGSANGMSITNSITRLPGNRSRTSTQAIRVPITALMTVTINELRIVSRSEVEGGGGGDRTPEARPAVAESLLDGRAERDAGRAGSTTAPPCRGRGLRRGRARCPVRSGRRRLPRAVTSPAADAMLTTAMGQLPLDPSILVTMPSVSPKNSSLTLSQPPSRVDGDQFLRRRVRVARVFAPWTVPGVDTLGGRAPALAREDLLAGAALGVGQEVLGGLRCGLGDGRRRLDEHRLLGDDVVEVLALLPSGDRLALVRDQRVAGARLEGLRGVRSTRGLADDVLEELGQVGLGLGRRCRLRQMTCS